MENLAIIENQPLIASEKKGISERRGGFPGEENVPSKVRLFLAGKDWKKGGREASSTAPGGWEMGTVAQGLKRGGELTSTFRSTVREPSH